MKYATLWNLAEIWYLRQLDDKFLQQMRLLKRSKESRHDTSYESSTTYNINDKLTNQLNINQIKHHRIWQVWFFMANSSKKWIRFRGINDPRHQGFQTLTIGNLPLHCLYSFSRGSNGALQSCSKICLWFVKQWPVTLPVALPVLFGIAYPWLSQNYLKLWQIQIIPKKLDNYLIAYPWLSQKFSESQNFKPWDSNHGWQRRLMLLVAESCPIGCRCRHLLVTQKIIDAMVELPSGNLT